MVDSNPDPQATFYAYTRPMEDGSSTRVLSRPALDVLKLLKGEGFRVRVEPEDASSTEYFVRKGLRDFLEEPLYVLLTGIPISIFTNLLASWIYARLSDRDNGKIPEETNIVVGVRDSGKTVFYNHKGREVSEERAKEIFSLLRQQADGVTSVRSTRSPYPDMPFPICLEHSSVIVGWAKLQETAEGLRASPGIIDDDATWIRIQKGELRGASISGIVKRSECSICRRSYSDCRHISGLEYEGKECVNLISEFELCEVSIVTDPLNPDCLLSFKQGNTHT